MLPNGESLVIILFSQIIVGVLGNTFLLYFYIFNFITSYQKKPIDLILTHLSLLNVMFLLSTGIPHIITSLGMINAFDDIECKIIIYIGRVFQGLCLCSNCLLSTFQAIILGTDYLMCGWLKARATKCVIPSLFLCWIFNLLVHIAVPVSVTAPRNHTITRNRWRLGFCAFDIYATGLLKIRMWTFIYEAMWCVLTVCANIYSMVVMKRHHQRVLHIHSTKFSPRASPEIRAAKAILILISSFICFRFVSYTLFFLYMFSIVTNFWIIYASMLMTRCFPTFSPFILIFSDPRIFRFFISSLGIKNSISTTAFTISD